MFSRDDRTDGVSGLSLPICGLLINRSAVGLDGQDLDHRSGVVWDPGIVCHQFWHVCSDCHVWAEWSFWTEIESGCCRTINWTLGYLGCIDPPCDVDSLYSRDDWRINEVVLVVTPGGCNDIRFDFEMIVCIFCVYVLLCILPYLQQLLGIFGVCSPGFPRFASLSEVFPPVLGVMFDRSLFLSTFVLGGGGG